ncbi:hypothetical protein MASR2M17_09050 [Aminivibrio sp.]
MKKTTLLKRMINERKALVCPGAHDAISAMLIERAGFKALQVSGFGLSATYLGLPDMAFLGFSDVLNFTRNIAETVKIPVMADADTGYGNSINAMYVTKEFLKAGLAGMNIEDQVFPKRCGHIEGKQIILLENGAKDQGLQVGKRRARSGLRHQRPDGRHRRGELKRPSAEETPTPRQGRTPTSWRPPGRWSR